MLLTDVRFSGVSTGPCVGHISPEAWAGGAHGKLRDGDRLRLHIDTCKLEGSVDFVTVNGSTAADAAAELAARPRSDRLTVNPDKLAPESWMQRAASSLFPTWLREQIDPKHGAN